MIIPTASKVIFNPGTADWKMNTLSGHKSHSTTSQIGQQSYSHLGKVSGVAYSLYDVKRRCVHTVPKSNQPHSRGAYIESLRRF